MALDPVGLRLKRNEKAADRRMRSWFKKRMRIPETVNAARETKRSLLRKLGEAEKLMKPSMVAGRVDNKEREDHGNPGIAVQDATS